MSWIDQVSGLEQLPDELRDQLLAKSNKVLLKEGDLVFGPEKTPENLLLLLDGTLRVQQLSADGREIVLFRASGGESCVMTTACLMAYEDYSAEGRAETDIEAIAIPRNFFEELVSTSKEFRKFMFQAYSRRISDLFLTIEDIAFKRMDVRLAQRLLELVGDSNIVKYTHSQLATELGTAREVISRQLSEFQRRSWVRVGRGAVELTNIEALEQIVEKA